jgi:hypothetical protein
MSAPPPPTAAPTSRSQARARPSPPTLMPALMSALMPVVVCHGPSQRPPPQQQRPRRRPLCQRRRAASQLHLLRGPRRRGVLQHQQHPRVLLRAVPGSDGEWRRHPQHSALGAPLCAAPTSVAHCRHCTRPPAAQAPASSFLPSLLSFPPPRPLCSAPRRSSGLSAGSCWSARCSLSSTSAAVSCASLCARLPPACRLPPVCRPPAARLPACCPGPACTLSPGPRGQHACPPTRAWLHAPAALQ